MVCRSCPCWPYSLAYLVLGSTILHSHGCHWASAAFSYSALICSSLVCHSDWPEQTFTWCSSCWQLPLNLRLLELWTFGSDVTGDVAVMIGRQASFGWMLLDNLCRIMISILTNNIALTFYMSPMRRDIFRWGRIFNFTFPQSILLNPRHRGIQ
jgi:hypothetical protein